MALYTYTIEPTDDNQVGKPLTYGEADDAAYLELISKIRNIIDLASAATGYSKSTMTNYVTLSRNNIKITTQYDFATNTNTFVEVRAVPIATYKAKYPNDTADYAKMETFINFAISALQEINKFMREHTSPASNISQEYGILAAYNWSSSTGSGRTYSFKNGQHMRWGRASTSYGNILISGSTGNSYYGAIGVPFFPGVINYDNITHSTIASRIYLKSYNNPARSIAQAKLSIPEFYVYKNSYSYLTTNSNGEITEALGWETRFQRGGYGNFSSFMSSSASESNMSPKEFHHDSDNTYPGGGDDKNTYPDEGSDELGGESGKGDFDNTNDPIDFPTLPTFDVQSTGFISLWNPTITQLTNLYTFLWDSDISTTLKKLFNEPMNAIFSLGIVPVDPVTQGTRRLTIGHVDTEIDMESIQKQFVTFDFGSIDINEYYGAAWDYSPYTQASIYLPYIGVQPVDIDDIMNCTLTLRYNIDVLTGTTIALLKCVRKGRDNLNAVMYEWQGNCVTQCPITAGNWSQIMASVIQLGAMTGLALSQPVVGAIGSAVGSSAAAEYAQGKNLVNPTMATYGALNVLGSKVHVQRGGRLDMSSGAMSMQKSFVILNRPVSGIPRGWNKYAGYPSLKIKTLGSQEGFVSVGAIKLDGLRATAEEINELDTILKTGVII